MITKELSSGGEEVFAVSGEGTCLDCIYSGEGPECSAAKCKPSERPDRRDVYFVPLTDVKTMLAYTLQEHA